MAHYLHVVLRDTWLPVECCCVRHHTVLPGTAHHSYSRNGFEEPRDASHCSPTIMKGFESQSEKEDKTDHSNQIQILHLKPPKFPGRKSPEMIPQGSSPTYFTTVLTSWSSIFHGSNPNPSYSKKQFWILQCDTETQRTPWGRKGSPDQYLRAGRHAQHREYKELLWRAQHSISPQSYSLAGQVILAPLTVLIFSWYFWVLFKTPSNCPYSLLKDRV